MEGFQGHLGIYDHCTVATYVGICQPAGLIRLDRHAPPPWRESCLNHLSLNASLRVSQPTPHCCPGLCALPPAPKRTPPIAVLPAALPGLYLELSTTYKKHV